VVICDRHYSMARCEVFEPELRCDEEIAS